MTVVRFRACCEPLRKKKKKKKKKNEKQNPKSLNPEVGTRSTGCTQPNESKAAAQKH